MLVYADYARGWLKWVNPYNSVQGGTVLDDAGSVVDLQEAPDGSLVWVNLGFMGGTMGPGFIARLSTDKIRSSSLSRRFGKLPLKVRGVSSYVDPVWDWGDGSTSVGQKSEHVYKSQGVFTVKVSSGGSLVDSFQVKAGFEPQPIRINGPARVSGGRSVSMRLSRPASWNVTLIHSEHAHPVLSGKGQVVRFKAARDHGLDSYYLVSANDEGEFAASARRKVRYASARFSILGPRGLSVEVAGVSRRLPFRSREAVGHLLTVAAPAESSLSGRRITFASWNIGGPATRQVTVPRSGLKLRLRYR